MTQEDKELLLKDLSSRLPYNVKVNEEIQGDFTLLGIVEDRVITNCNCEYKYNDFPIELIKPYLRPMYSMTEEEKNEFESLGWRVDELDDNMPWNHNSYNVFDGVDWLTKNMFDYRGLIPMGLALKASEGMYNIKEK